MNFFKGQKVKTPLGEGTVAWQRMAPPSYSQAEAVSVRLSGHEADYNYTGTVFSADKVMPLESVPLETDRS